MPPRYAYWTILVDDQPTAFRSGSQEELMPTFKRLQAKNASAKMMWWQNGKLWDSRLDAQEAMRARGEIGRSRDFRQGTPGLSERRPTASGGRRESKGERYSDRAPKASERREEREPSGKLDWKPKGEPSVPPAERRAKKPEWVPKSQVSTFAKAPADKPGPTPHDKPAWKPKGSFTPERSTKPDWKPKAFGARPKADWKPRTDWKPKRAPDARSRSEKLEWKPKGEGISGSRIPDPGSPEKRKWVPKEEYKKSLGIEAKKDKNWRPGGEHKDPRQKYKDAKKAKWGRFKQTIRKRSESKTGKKNNK